MTSLTFGQAAATAVKAPPDLEAEAGREGEGVLSQSAPVSVTFYCLRFHGHKPCGLFVLREEVRGKKQLSTLLL